MFNKIINSPYTLGFLLACINVGLQFITGTSAYVFGLLLPLSVIISYTYLTKEKMSKHFKYLTVLSSFVIALIFRQLIDGGLSHLLKAISEAHPGVAIIAVTATVLVVFLINYLFLTVGNKAGLWIRNKTK